MTHQPPIRCESGTAPRPRPALTACRRPVKSRTALRADFGPWQICLGFGVALVIQTTERFVKKRAPTVRKRYGMQMICWNEVAFGRGSTLRCVFQRGAWATGLYDRGCCRESAFACDTLLHEIGGRRAGLSGTGLVMMPLAHSLRAGRTVLHLSNRERKA